MAMTTGKVSTMASRSTRPIKVVRTLFSSAIDMLWRLRAAAHERVVRRPWLRAAREAGLYAGYADWTGVMAVDDHAKVWFVPHGTPWAKKEPVDEPEFQHAARAQAALRYPRVRAVQYDRPGDAEACPTCSGTGVPHQLPPSLRYRVICQCGGSGWIPPGWSSDATSAGPRAAKGFNQPRGTSS
jgi:hypothetical protein